MNSANKIFAEISVGELLDKISILEIKQKNLKDTEKTKIVTKELESLNNTLKNDVKPLQILPCKAQKDPKRRKRSSVPISGPSLR